MNGNQANAKYGIKTNVDSFEVKQKKDHVTLTFFAATKQVAQVNFPKKPLGMEYLQQLQEAVWSQ